MVHCILCLFSSLSQGSPGEQGSHGKDGEAGPQVSTGVAWQDGDKHKEEEGRRNQRSLLLL